MSTSLRDKDISIEHRVGRIKPIWIIGLIGCCFGKYRLVYINVIVKTSSQNIAWGLRLANKWEIRLCWKLDDGKITIFDLQGKSNTYQIYRKASIFDRIRLLWFRLRSRKLSKK